MNCVAIHHHWDAFLGGRLAQSLNENEHSGRLRVEEPGFVANHHMVEHDVNVWDLVGVERSDESVGQRCLIATLDQQLQNAADLHDAGHAEALARLLLILCLQLRILVLVNCLIHSRGLARILRHTNFSRLYLETVAPILIYSSLNLSGILRL